MDASVVVTLPNGIWRDETRYYEAELRPLAGSDEAFLLEMGDGLLPVQQTTGLLARCVTRLGRLQPVAPDDIRGLTVGDREALCLHLRRLTLGDRLQCLVSCPSTACGKPMDLELSVRELLLPPYAEGQATYETSIGDEGDAYCVRFRLPTGADQEAVAALGYQDMQSAAQRLLRYCVVGVIKPDGGETPADGCPPVLYQVLSARMAELDPQAELTLNLTCPECGLRFAVLFDTASYFLQELADRLPSLYREVHELALHYHWSEAEIMAMTARKRRLYLDLLGEALAEGRRA